MSNNWGPHFIMPTDTLKSYSGGVQLREELDEGLLQKELKELGISGNVSRITNPWYYRPKGAGSWIKIGESENSLDNFPVMWDTRKLENGQYEILGLMHVFVDAGDSQKAIARQNIVEVTVKN